LHWDGAQWTQRDLPGTASIQLAAVSAVSDSDVWVVGQQGPTAVTYHWDGSSWSQPPAPSADESLAGITAVSADNVWAVGTASGGPVEPFVMHWDGSSWTRVQVPIPGGSNVSTFLTGIASSSASDVWVSGISLRSPQQPFALHWDGSSWAVVTLVPNLVPVGGLGVAATAVAVSSRGQAWLVGTRSDDQVTWAEPAPVVPDGILTPGNADSTFRQFGLSSGPVSHTTNCPASSVGAIVGVSPAQGQRVPFGTPVGVTVCDAPAPVPVPVPDLFGFDDGTARDTITSLGLSVGPVRMAANCSVSRGDVFSQSPGPGTMLLPGSAVSLTESNGRQGNGRLCPIE
jgi:hypothetical protein